MDSCNNNMVDGNITSTSLTSLFRALEAQMTVDRVVADTQNRAAVPGFLGFFQAGQLPATSFGNLASGPSFPSGLGIHSAKPNRNSIHGNFFLPYKSCLLSHTSIPHRNGAGLAAGPLTGLGARLDQPTAVSQAANVFPQLNFMRTDQQPGRPAQAAPAASLQQSATQQVTWANSSEYMRPKTTPEQTEEGSQTPAPPPPDRKAASHSSSKGKAASASVPFDDNGQVAQLSQQGRAGAAGTGSRPRTSRACVVCRQGKNKCDYGRPCRTCIIRGMTQQCVDEPKAVACFQCYRRRLKCDRQRPCARCVKLEQGDPCCDPPFPQQTVHRPRSAWEDKAEAGETDSNDERPALTDESYSGKRKENAALVASSASPQGEGREFVVQQAMAACDGGSSPTRRASQAFAPADGSGKTLARGGRRRRSSSSTAVGGGMAGSDAGGMHVRPRGIEPQFEQQFQTMITVMDFRERENASNMVRDLLSPIFQSSFEAGIKLTMQQHQRTNVTTNSLSMNAANGDGDEGGSGRVGRRKRIRVSPVGADAGAGQGGEDGGGGRGGKRYRRLSISAEEAITELKAVIIMGVSSSDEEVKEMKLGGLAAKASRPMTYSLVVHRPFHFHTAQNISSIPNRGEILQALNACFGEGLLPNPFVRFFESGWCFSGGMRLFTDLPPEVKSAVDDVVETIQTLLLAKRSEYLSASRHSMSFAHRLLGGAAPTGEVGAASTGEGGAARRACVSPYLIHGSASSTQPAPAGACSNKEKEVLPASGGVAAKNEQNVPSSASRVVVEGDGVVRVGSIDMDVEVDVGRPSQRLIISVEDLKQEDEEEAFVNHIRALTEKYKMTQYVGVYCFEWDPETGSRKKIHISETLCNLLDMHTEELIARVGASEHMLANTEMEVLSILLNEITSLGIFSEHLGRVVICDPITRKLKRQFLVRRVALRELDSLGRIVRTIHLIDRITPEQYDEICLEKQTKNGRNVLWEEDRTGDELCDDAGKDYLFDETLASLTQDPMKITQFVSRIRARTQNLKKVIERLHQEHNPFKESNIGIMVLPSSLSI